MFSPRFTLATTLMQLIVGMSLHGVPMLIRMLVAWHCVKDAFEARVNESQSLTPDQKTRINRAIASSSFDMLNVELTSSGLKLDLTSWFPTDLVSIAPVELFRWTWVIPYMIRDTEVWDFAKDRD